MNGLSVFDADAKDGCIAASAIAPSIWHYAQAAQAPHPLASVHVEGLLPHQGLYDESDAALRDTTSMRDLALAWRLAPDPALLNKLNAYLDAWSTIYRPSFNPIDETRFDGLIEAYRLTQGHLPPQTDRHVRSLLSSFARGYLDQMDRHAHDAAPLWVNNWQSHRVKIAAMAAFALGDPVLMARARTAYMAQLAANIRADGHVQDFEERNAIHYVTYNLNALLRAALAARWGGQDWLNLTGPKGQTLKNALLWLRPYAEGHLTHLEFAGSSVKFDVERAKAGVAGYSGLWDVRDAADVYWAASLLDPMFQSLAQALSSTPPRWLLVYADSCSGVPG